MAPINELDPKVIKKCRPFILENKILKKIVKKFLQHLTMSLTAEECEKTPVKCNLTHVNHYPDGTEKDSFIGLDFSGKMFRVAHLTLKGDFSSTSNSSKLYQFPERRLSQGIVKTMEYVAKCISDFIENSDVTDEKIVLGVASSFPILQENLQEGTLVQWSKDFTSPELTDENMFHHLKMALKKFKFTKNVYLISLVSSSTACLLSGLYQYPRTRVGFYLGDNINLTYIEKFKNMTVFKAEDFRTITAVGVGIRNFGDDGCLDFIRTEFDFAIDEASPNPGKDVLEKLVSGANLGEIVRLCLCDLASLGVIFGGRITDNLSNKNSIKTSDLMFMEMDKVDVYYRCKAVLHYLGYENATDEDCIQVRFVGRCAAKRSASIVGACLAALIQKMENKQVHIFADGSLIRDFPLYSNYLTQKINKLLKKELGFRIVFGNKEEVTMGAGIVASIYKKPVMKIEDKLRTLPLYNTGKYHPAMLSASVRECECNSEKVFARKTKSSTRSSFRDDSSISRVLQVSEPLFVNPMFSNYEIEF